MTVGENIKRIREECGLSQKELEQLSGLSAGVICDVERGRYEPRLTTLRLIVKTLSVRVSDLLGEDDWIPVWTEKFPKPGQYVLVSFSNCSAVMMAYYDEDEEGGAFYVTADKSKNFSLLGFFINAWQPLPEKYREEANEEN